MIRVIPCGERLEELVQFVARLNSDGTHHIGFFGEGEADVRSSLAECVTPPAAGFMMAYEGDDLAGILGVDLTPEIRRAWLFGPIVDHADWHAIADQLYQRVLPLIPATIRDRDMFCDVRNVNLDGFAARHRFPLNSENAVMSLARGDYMPFTTSTARVVPYQEEVFERFEALHKTLFPNAYFTARQMVEKRDQNHRLFLALQDGKLLGFHFCQVDPESASGYVDFIGTDVNARGLGIGADVFAAGIEWMLSVPSTKKISLTVHADNMPAIRLYEKFGFATERVMRGYRQRVGE